MLMLLLLLLLFLKLFKELKKLFIFYKTKLDCKQTRKWVQISHILMKLEMNRIQPKNLHVVVLN